MAAVSLNYLRIFPTQNIPEYQALIPNYSTKIVSSIQTINIIKNTKS